jgi:uncharacterized integral membrane protein
MARDQSNSPADSEAAPKGRGNVRLVGVAVAGVLLVWFALANLGSVSIKFWVSERRAPLILVIVISGLLGALIAMLAQRYKSQRN